MSSLDTVRPAERGDVPALSSVLARAFQDDPVTRWIMPDDEHRRRLLPDVYARQLRTWFLGHGLTQVCCRDGRILAGALWSTPHRPHPSMRAQLSQLPEALRLGLGVRRLFAVFSTIAAARPASPHWHLSELGADPSAQRTGLGDRLIRTQLERCDSEAVPTYLEAPEHNIEYYRRYGFAVTATIAIPSGPTVYGMWRPAPG